MREVERRERNIRAEEREERAMLLKNDLSFVEA
jgi:hypothetical protein